MEPEEADVTSSNASRDDGTDYVKGDGDILDEYLY